MIFGRYGTDLLDGRGLWDGMDLCDGRDLWDGRHLLKEALFQVDVSLIKLKNAISRYVI